MIVLVCECVRTCAGTLARKCASFIHPLIIHSFTCHSFIHSSFIHSRNRDHLRARHCALQWKQNDDKTFILGQPTSLGQMGTHWEAPRSGAPGALQGQCARSRRAPRGCVRWGRASWHGGDRGGRGCRPVTEQSLLQEPRAGRDGEGGGTRGSRRGLGDDHRGPSLRGTPETTSNGTQDYGREI